MTGLWKSLGGGGRLQLECFHFRLMLWFLQLHDWPLEVIGGRLQLECFHFRLMLWFLQLHDWPLEVIGGGGGETTARVFSF